MSMINSKYREPYKIFILDEAHERTNDLDIIMGLFHEFILTRDDVRLIITSATINPKKFKDFFNAGTISCIKEYYPISINYTGYYLKKRYYFDTLDLAKQVLYTKLNQLEKGETILVFLADTQQVRSAEFTFKNEFCEYKDS